MMFYITGAVVVVFAVSNVLQWLAIRRVQEMVTDLESRIAAIARPRA